MSTWTPKGTAPRNETLDLIKVALMCIRNFQWGSGHDMLFGLDGKRPFGNSSWEVDVLEELKIEPAGEHECYSDEQDEYARELVRKVPEYLEELAQKDWDGRHS